MERQMVASLDLDSWDARAWFSKKPLTEQSVLARLADGNLQCHAANQGACLHDIAAWREHIWAPDDNGYQWAGVPCSEHGRPAHEPNDSDWTSDKNRPYRAIDRNDAETILETYSWGGRIVRRRLGIVEWKWLSNAWCPTLRVAKHIYARAAGLEKLAKHIGKLLRELADQPIQPGDEPEWWRSRGELLAAARVALSEEHTRISPKALLKATRTALDLLDLLDEEGGLGESMNASLKNMRDHWHELAVKEQGA